MKNHCRFLIVLVLITCLTHCQSVVVVEPFYSSPSEKINLDLVKMITPSEASKEANKTEEGTKEKKAQLTSEQWVVVDQNENGKPFIQLELFFGGSGINIIEEIINGTILDHHIVARNQRGDIIARQPINFQAFEVTEIKTEKIKNKVLIGEGKTEIKLNASGKESENTRKAERVRYTDKDTVPQALELSPKGIPSINEYISIYIELTFLNPFLEGACDSSDANCGKDKPQIFEGIAKKNRLQLDLLKSKYEKGEYVNFENLTEEEIEFEKKVIRDNINSLNRSLTAVQETKPNGNTSYEIKTHTPNGNRYAYREWNLVTTPHFFKIQNILKNGKPSIVETPESKNNMDPLIKKEEKSTKGKNESEMFESPFNLHHKKKVIKTP